MKADWSVIMGQLAFSVSIMDRCHFGQMPFRPIQFGLYHLLYFDEDFLSGCVNELVLGTQALGEVLFRNRPAILDPRPLLHLLQIQPRCVWSE